MGLKKSSLSPGNRMLFWAEFGSGCVAGDGGNGTASGNVSSFFDFEVIKICVHMHTLGGNPTALIFTNIGSHLGLYVHAYNVYMYMYLIYYCLFTFLYNIHNMHVKNFEVKQQKSVQMCTYCTDIYIHVHIMTIDGSSVYKHSSTCTPCMLCVSLVIECSRFESHLMELKSLWLSTLYSGVYVYICRAV